MADGSIAPALISEQHQYPLDDQIEHDAEIEALKLIARRRTQAVWLTHKARLARQRQLPWTRILPLLDVERD